MIKFLSNWIEEIAIAVIVASIFEMIIPNGNIKKYIKIILGIYVIFSIISPFMDNKKLYNLEVSEIIDKYSETQNMQNNNQNETKANLNNMYISTFEKQIVQTVQSQGYTVYKCSVEANFDTEKEDTGIKRIKIILQDKTEKQENDKSMQNIEKIEEIEISIGKNADENYDNSKISKKDIADLKNYLSEHYEIDKKIIDIQKR